MGILFSQDAGTRSKIGPLTAPTSIPGNVTGQREPMSRVWSVTEFDTRGKGGKGAGSEVLGSRKQEGVEWLERKIPITDVRAAQVYI